MVLFQIFYFISNNKLYRPAGDSNSIAKKKLNKLSDLQLIVRVYDIESNGSFDFTINSSYSFAP